jgi:hypothetical protein
MGVERPGIRTTARNDRRGRITVSGSPGTFLAYAVRLPTNILYSNSRSIAPTIEAIHPAA